MALYYKFLSAKNYDSIPMLDPFISVSVLKRQIFESKYKAKKDSNSINGLCFGTDYDIAVINPETNEEYVNDSILIPNNSKVFIRRVPGGRGGRNPIDVTTIVVGPQEETNCVSGTSSSSSSSSTVTSVDSLCSSESSVMGGFDFDPEFGGDVFAAKQNRGTNAVRCEEDDEKRRIEELVNTPALDWTLDKRWNVYKRVVPHAGYVCRRCNVAGHFIQHCPTNSHPNYGFNTSTPPTGIPKSKLAAAVSVSDEAAFDKAMEGIPSAGRSKQVGVIPAELACPLCKDVMNDAVICSKCCFTSYCYKCMRDHLLQFKSVCVCGATNILADYLIPNITLRNTINHYLESNTSSSQGSNGVDSVREAASASNKISSTTTATAPVREERKRTRVEEEGGVSDEIGKKKKKRKMEQVESKEGGYRMPNGYNNGYDANWAGYMPYNYGYYNNSAQYGSVMPRNHFYSYYQM